MIARIWRGVVRVADAETYLAYLHATGVADYQASPGNLGVSILQRDVEAGVEFTALTFWDSWDAIRAFAGDQPEVAHYYPEDDRYLIVKEPLVDHFDVPFSDLVFAPRPA